jgi:hypothetical protein
VPYRRASGLADFAGTANFAGIAPGKSHALRCHRPGKRCGKTAPELRFAGTFHGLGQDAPLLAQVLQAVAQAGPPARERRKLFAPTTPLSK